MMFDFHTHRKPKVACSALVNCFPEAFDAQVKGCFSVGIHPWYVRKIEDEEGYWENLTSILNLPQVLAIGEVGIDRVAKTSLDLQMDVFARQVELSEKLGKPLVIHAVHADDLIFYFKRKLKPLQPWAIHGFRSKPVVLKKYLDAGFYVSFGERCNVDALCEMPFDRMFLETDESLLPIEEIYDRVANIRGVSMQELERQLDENLHRFLGRAL